LDGKEQNILEASLGRIVQSCRIDEVEDTNYKTKDARNRLVGWIRYDCDNEENIDRLRCIAIAQHKYPNHGWPVHGGKPISWIKYTDVSWGEKLVPGDFHYVLLVEGINPGEEYVKEVYRRVGVALIHSKHLSFEPPVKAKVV
jgi:hypothetical protein